MWNKVITIMEPYRTKTIFIGCSGGIDSMVLAHFLHQNGFRIHLLHVNYQKRGASSDADMEFVQSFAQQHRIPCNIRLYPNIMEGNFQEEARLFRYRFFEEFAVDNDQLIALAHHADDNIETFFMNLSRKAGIMGLASIPQIRGKYIRPMLHLWKEDIIEYAQQNNVPWQEDASNLTNAYYRNRWRLEYLPMLEKQIPSLKQSTATLIRAFAQTQQFLAQKMQGIAHEILHHKRIALSFYTQYSTEELFELWRQLHQRASIFPRFLALKTYPKGKFIETKAPFVRIVREDSYLQCITSTKELNWQLKITIVNALPDHFSKNTLYLDPAKINGELFLRRWKHGDKIASVGIKGTQSVAKIIKDAKIPIEQRETISVVCDKTTIHWVVGLKIGRTAIAHQHHKQFIKVERIEAT